MNTIALDMYSTALAHVNNMPFVSCLLKDRIFVSTRMHHSNAIPAIPPIPAIPAIPAAGAEVGAVGAAACAGAGTLAGENDAANWPGPANAPTAPGDQPAAGAAAVAGAPAAPAVGAGTGAWTPSFRRRIVFSCLSLAGGAGGAADSVLFSRNSRGWFQRWWQVHA